MKQKWLLPLRDKALAFIKTETVKQETTRYRITFSSVTEQFSCRTKTGGYKFYHVEYDRKRNDVVIYNLDFLKRIN